MAAYEDSSFPCSHSYGHLSPSYIQSLTSREDLDREIAALVVTLSTLRTRRNELASINALPAEVLANVCAHCIPQGHMRQRRDYAEGVRFMLVCRAWCAVGRQHPAIWSSISCYDFFLTRILLARSKMAPIDVYTSNEDIGSQRLAFAHLGRTRTLEFLPNRTRSEMAEDCAQMIASTPAPYLVSASFGRRDPFRERRWLHLPPGELFNMQTPQLRTLSFTDCLFDWSILVQPSLTCKLTSLTLVTCLSFAIDFTASDFCSALNTMPFLVTLTVKLCVDSERGHCGLSHSGTAMDQMVMLLSLRELTLHGPPVRVFPVLHVLSIPKSTKLDISLFNISEMRTTAGTQPLVDLSAVTELLYRHGVSLSGADAVRKLVIRGNYKQGCISIQGFVKDGDDIYSKQCLSIAVNIPPNYRRGYKQDHARQLRVLVSSLCKVIHECQVKILVVQLDVGDRELSAVLREALTQASDLRYLQLCGDAAASLAEMLGPWQTTDEREWHALFPCLTKLELFQVHLDGDSGLRDLVVKTLRTRHEHCAAQLKAMPVRLKQCSAEGPIVEALKRGLGNCATVKVDGNQA